jgi:hypothetical protein
MNASSMLEQLQGVAVGALSADSLFNGSSSANKQAVPIVTELKGDISTQFETAIGSVGICAVVLTPLFEFIDNLLYDLSGWAYPVIDIYENVALNQGNGGTQIRAIQLAQRTLCVLHRYPTGLPTNPTEVVPSFIGLPKPFELLSPGPPLAYQVSFKAYCLLTG